MSNTFKEAVAEVCEIMQFENWLRFYFIQEKGEELMVVVPEKAMEHFREKYPHLAPLAEKMNNETITYEKSVNTVCQYVVSSLDGQKYGAGVVTNALDSPEFQNEMYLFHVWAQSHESQLEKAPLEFETWQKLFAEWKQSDQVQKLLKQADAKAQQAAPCSTDTVQ